ncbi:hypothetical protein HHI36_001592 [Cryptolaemus montrouzieri]|uniref:FYVE-type domain-containing protein n=1 Tax=Cryptolaemus montrouzieri TaxID=559131 RepID=A0ABD2P8S8_9CUCU
MLLMNTKFDKLATVLEVCKKELSQSDFKEVISIEKIDEILRAYAEKSLDFRVVTQPFPRVLRSPELKFIESLDSVNSEKKSFIMPEEIPTKDQWIPNSEALECMCCQNVIFSMFNRRHHCRRCGRVVCYTCSLKRMEVPLYGDIAVRVCKDCYELTMEESISSETISTRSGLNESWLLTDDEEHNRIIREEFSYEHAPSVSLCLSILKYHSHTIEYPKFLLDQCNNLLKLLNPSQGLAQEIDYLLVIRMLKSLAMAAKMMSQECSLLSGLSMADKFLNQADLLGLFSERGCLNLLPISSNNQILNINTSLLRRLRDKLLENEQWNLALEVSTKAGLDRTGVFAAWGKSCLKAGSLTKAREKFQRCLDKRGRYESYSESIPEMDSTDEGSLSGSSRNLNKSSNELSEKKPLKNPPLLDEIIHILELKTAVIDRNIVDEIVVSGVTASTTTLNQSSSIVQKDPAISILNKLRNLDHIAAGRYYFPTDRKVQTSFATNRPIVDTVFYNECIFYLSRYGSHQSLLEFYLKHCELDQALQYVVDNNMGSELFIDIYMRCLKDGLVNILQENIAKIDSTLDLWKNYLRQLCHHLEKQKLLHCLYQLQLFMGDYMRAAMTCIRFYQENTYNFSDLSRKNNFLLKAEEHMKQIHEQEQWVEVAPVRNISTSSMESFEEKSITNPSLVMKLDTKNINSYLNTIWRQNEVSSFLADCEAAGMEPMRILESILPEDSDSNPDNTVPTLFGSNMDKVRIAILILVTSVQMEQGFRIVLRLIQDFKLRPGTVYCQTGKHLAKLQKYESIMELVQCIRKESNEDKILSEICDEMLTLAVATLTKEKAPAARVEDLIKLITDRGTKISAYIEAKQLKTAYFFAVRFKRMSDIRRILREAELNNQPSIKTLCVKVLQAHSQLPSNLKE